MKYFIINILFLLSIIYAEASVTLDFPGESAASVGILIKDLATDSVIAENDSGKALLPASVMKALTAATAISTLDNDFKFHTKIYLTGNVADGVCNGNLLVVSSADPTIDSNLFNDRPTLSSLIVEQLNLLGIKQINGKIIIDETLSDPGCVPQWEIDDVAWDYGAGLYGFNFRDNCFTVHPATGQSSPHVPDLVITLQYAPTSDLLRGIFSNNLYAFNPNCKNPKWTVETTMNSPATVFAYELEQKLANAGIAVKSRKVDDTAHIAVLDYTSPSLNEILHQMMVHSHNLYAEGMLRAIAPKSDRNTAIEKECSIWNHRGVKTSYMRICDGSGLSRGDRLRPTFIAQMLNWMANSKFANDYVALFPKSGVDGTVRNFLKGTRLEGKMALKTGSMTGVQCYAGYKLDDSGKPTHAVVILINGFYCERKTLREKIEKFLLKTF